jgi:hypothetical protein
MTIYIVPIESIDTRYTKQWYDHIPKLLDNHGQNVVIIEGDAVPPKPTNGAFLDFGATNIYKSSQLQVIAELFRNKAIEPGSKFLYTDAWNPTVIQLKYMSSLLHIPIEIHGMWHAGSYDPQDFLGRLIGNTPWIRHAEQSMFNCYDYNWFATRYHAGIFAREILDVRNIFSRDITEAAMHWYKNIQITGWPMEYLYDTLEPYSKLQKKKQIVFPHRLAPEKQLNIFKDLANSMPEYEWIVCQEKTLTKDEYHTILGESAIIFSANLQETYGISTIEGFLCGATPLVPDRLSYSEMWLPEYRYTSGWTFDYTYYLQRKDMLINWIKTLMDEIFSNSLRLDTARINQTALLKDYTSAETMVNVLIK